MERRCAVECRQTDKFQLQNCCDIVKRGTLYVKHPPSFLPAAFNIQPWKKRYVVLRDTWYCSPCVMTSLDIYDSEPASLGCHGDRVSSSSSGSGSARSLVPGRGHEPYSVDLRTLTAVGFHLVSRRFQFAFYVERCDDRPLLFAAESDLEMRCWVAALRMLADKARMASPDSCRRCISAASSDRRSTLPSVDVSGIPLLLDGRRRNLSDPQLHAVPLALRGRHAIYPSQPRSGPLHVGLRRKLTAPADINDASFLHRSLASANEVDAVPLVPTHSPVGAAAAGAVPDSGDGHHPLRRLFSASVLISLLGRDIGAGRRRGAFSKDRRKDSGFSESFDDGTCDFTEPPTVHGQDSPGGRNSPTTRTRTSPPPRPPPRRTTTVDDRPTTSPRLPAPPPPPPREHADIDERPEPSPPTPPPRPPHTLPPLSFAASLQ